MSNIEEVIARSRQPGQFSERKSFTFSRQRAIQKIRDFALANPYFYILELIQAAIANGATYLNIEIERSMVVVSYSGGTFSEEELAQLFDFLFTSKERLDLAHVRQLALGINALFRFSPKEVIVESGNGTLQGTTLVRIDGRGNSVEVGTPTRPLNGTYLRASGLSFKRLAERGWNDQLAELEVIEERCLCAPIPIIVNGIPLFGFSSHRIPSSFGWHGSITFDEGDLYGVMGFTPHHDEEAFKLMTWGVWVGNVRRLIVPGLNVGGIVVFDRLRKTADHAGIVEDERFEEMWTRLLPYARQLKPRQNLTGQIEVFLMDGTPLNSRALRLLAEEFDQLVLLSRSDGLDDEMLSRTQQIADLLGVPLIRCKPSYLTSLRLQLGNKVHIIVPDPSDPEEHLFYAQELAQPPARPWLIAPIEMEPIATTDLKKMLVSAGQSKAAKMWAGEIDMHLFGQIRTTIYTPSTPQEAGQLSVELWTAGRVLCRRSIPCAFSGFSLVIQLPSGSPALLERENLATHIVNVVVAHANPLLESATRRVVEICTRSRGNLCPTAQHIALSTLARAAILRLRSKPDGETSIRFSLLASPYPESILKVPLLQTLQGEMIALRQLEQIMEHTFGLVYGVVSDVEADLRGLDQGRILKLEPEEEQVIISLVGEAGYVRIDSRDVVARSGPWLCRDIALGLRKYSDGPLLLEREATDHQQDGDEQPIAVILQQLVKRFLALPKDQDDQELRRQAARHLIWSLQFPEVIENNPTNPIAVCDLPLFLDERGQPLSWSQLEPWLQRPEGVSMSGGWTLDGSRLVALQGPASLIARGTNESEPLLGMNPFVYHVLSHRGTIRPALDLDLSTSEARANPATGEVAFVHSMELERDGLHGVLGVPVVATERPTIAILDRERKALSYNSSIAALFGVVGYVELTASEPPAPSWLKGNHWEKAILSQLLYESCEKVLTDLLPGLFLLDSESLEYRRSVETLLSYAGQCIQLLARPNGCVVPRVTTASAQQILERPLFPTEEGVSLSGWQIVTEFVASHSSSDGEPAHSRLSATAPGYLRDWVEKHCNRERIIYPASHSAVSSSAPRTESASCESSALAGWLEEQLYRLRPDSVKPKEVRVSFSQPKGNPSNAPMFSLQRSREAFSLTIAPLNWLSKRAIGAWGHDLEPACWLLLACYAYINELLEPVTNEHELIFQRRVWELLNQTETSPQTRAAETAESGSLT